MQPKTKRTVYSRIVSKTRNKTGLPGVAKKLNDYVALIRFKGRTHIIGIYATAEAAHNAYLKTAKDLGIKIKLRK